MKRSGIVVLVVVLACSACSDEEDPTSAFCERTDAFEAHQDTLADALFDPGSTERHFATSIELLEGLADAAPPTVVDDVDTVLHGFRDLDQALQGVGYSVLEAEESVLDTSASDAASDRLDTFLRSACREEGDPFASPDEPIGPRPLTPAELRDLAPTDDDEATMVRSVTDQLAAELGLEPPTAACVVDRLDLSAISALADGDAITADVTTAFAEALAGCGVTLDGSE